MNRDRYGLSITTGSESAAASYKEGVDLLLAGWGGAAACFEQALSADPGLAVAHVARARLYAIYGDRAAALSSVTSARRFAQESSPREQQHVDILASAIEGKSRQAIQRAEEHLADHPRDAMVLSSLLGAFGLYAFSGSRDHDQARVAICERYASSYGEDWWFLTYRGWSHTENGDVALGRAITERALELRWENANAAHALAHAMFEEGNGEAAQRFISTWLPGYGRNGLLYGHIVWHQALTAAEMGDAAQAIALLRETLHPSRSGAPPLNLLTDLASLLWRLHIYGQTVPGDLWVDAASCSDTLDGKLGAPFAAVHFAMIEAATGRLGALERRIRELEASVQRAELPPGAVVPTLCRAIGAYGEERFIDAIDLLTNAMPDLPRIGGSHAQREIFEDTLVAACLRAGETEEAARLLDRRLHRRPSPRDQLWRSTLSL